MKFKKYLNEDIRDDFYINILPKIEKDCSQIIDMYKSSVRLHYRGYGNKTEELIRVKPRDNRKPSDVYKDVHDFLDMAFKKKFGWRARSEGVFVVPKYSTAKDYGNPYIFFPFNGFKYVWSPRIEDIWMSLLSKKETFLDEIDYDYMEEYRKRAMEYNSYYQFIEEIFFIEASKQENINKIVFENYIDDRLKENRKNEVMFKCKEYYLLSLKHEYILMDYLKGKKNEI